MVLCRRLFCCYHAENVQYCSHVSRRGFMSYRKDSNFPTRSVGCLPLPGPRGARELYTRGAGAALTLLLLRIRLAGHQAELLGELHAPVPFLRCQLVPGRRLRVLRSRWRSHDWRHFHPTHERAITERRQPLRQLLLVPCHADLETSTSKRAQYPRVDTLVCFRSRRWRRRGLRWRCRRWSWLRSRRCRALRLRGRWGRLRLRWGRLRLRWLRRRRRGCCGRRRLFLEPPIQLVIRQVGPVVGIKCSGKRVCGWGREGRVGRADRRRLLGVEWHWGRGKPAHSLHARSFVGFPRPSANPPDHRSRVDHWLSTPHFCSGLGRPGRPSEEAAAWKRGVSAHQRLRRSPGEPWRDLLSWHILCVALRPVGVGYDRAKLTWAPSREQELRSPR